MIYSHLFDQLGSEKKVRAGVIGTGNYATSIVTQAASMDRLDISVLADINPDAWDQLYTTKSLPFPNPATGKIAIKVINHFGDEAMKVYEVG